MAHKFLWLGTVSGLAIACAAPVMAADTGAPVEEIVVTGYAASLQKSLDAKEQSDAFTDVVTSEDIGKMPDKNVADALSRLPGIVTSSTSSGAGSFGENDRVAVRASSPSLTQLTINGHLVASGDWFVLDEISASGRSPSYELLPSEMVSSATVYKSQQADLIEGGTMGSINVVTQKPLSLKDNFTATITAGGAYNDLAAKAAPQVDGIIDWHNDAKTFGVQFLGFHEVHDLRRDGQEELGYTNVSGSAYPAGAQGAAVPTLINNALFTQTRTRDGGDLTLQWRPTDKLELVLDTFYSHEDDFELQPVGLPAYRQFDRRQRPPDLLRGQ